MRQYPPYRVTSIVSVDGPRESVAVSGRRVVVIGGAVAILCGFFVLWAFQRWGQDTFTRSARTVEARGRAYELAAAVARCMNRSARPELPPSAGPVPAEIVRSVHVAGKDSAAMFAADVFACAEFRPAGEIHVQVEWRRDDARHAVALTRIDENGDGRPDFEALSRVKCESPSPDRCHADTVEERRLP